MNKTLKQKTLKRKRSKKQSQRHEVGQIEIVITQSIESMVGRMTLPGFTEVLFAASWILCDLYQNPQYRTTITTLQTLTTFYYFQAMFRRST